MQEFIDEHDLCLRIKVDLKTIASLRVMCSLTFSWKLTLIPSDGRLLKLRS